MTQPSMPELHSEPDWAVGGLYSIRGWSSQFNVAKPLVIENGVIHTAIYQEQFATRPEEVDPTKLSIGSMNDDSFGIMHMLLQASVFADYEPKLIQREAVTDDDLHGYRTYLDYHPEGSGGAFGMDARKVN